MVSGRGANLGTATLDLRADRGRLKSDLAAAEKMTEARLQKFGQRARAAGAIAAGVGAALTVPLALSVKTFAQFEQSMANVRAVSGATTTEFQALTDVAREMGATTVFTANEAAQALSFMAMAGIEANDSIKALPAVLGVAAAGNLELAESADIITNIMSGFGIAAEGVGRATDVLVTGFTSANTNLLQLGEAFTYAGPVAKAAGLQFEETAAALALMGSAGIQGSLAGTSLRGAISRLLNPTGQAQEAMRRLGLTVLDSQGNLLPFLDIMKQLETVGLSASDAMTIFGLRAGPAMLALLTQGSGALQQLILDMEQSAGITQRIADQQLDTFQGQMTRLSSAVDAFAITIGSTLVPMLRSIVEFVTPVVQGFTMWAENNKGLATAIVLVTAGLGALLLVGGLSLIMAGAMAASFGALGLTMAGVKLAALGMWAAILGPVGWTIAAIAAIAVALKILYDRFEAVRNVVDKLKNTLLQIAGIRVGGVRTESTDLTPDEQLEAMRTGQGPEGQALDTSALARELADSTGKEVQKVTSALVTGSTRWQNVNFEDAQDDATALLIAALEQQTGDLIDGIDLGGGEDGDGGEGSILNWRDYVPAMSWPLLISPLRWPEFIARLNWRQIISDINWGIFVPNLSWLSFLPSLSWSSFLRPLSWSNFLPSLKWTSFVGLLSWLSYIPGLSWLRFVTNLNWSTWISNLSWPDWLKPVNWWNWIKSLNWPDWLKPVNWWNWIKGLSWWTWISPLSWWTWISSLSWWTWISPLSWWTWISSLSWWTWIKSLSWWTWIKSLSWWTWIKSLSWWTWISSLSWWTWISSLSWWTWISSLSWWTWISSLSWWTWISSLSWWTWISSLSWWTWISSLSWWTWIKSLSWWTWISSLSWWTWISSLSWWTWISSLSWWTWISSLSWWTWISSLSWWTWIKSLSWWTWIKSLSWWTWISLLSWSTWIKSLSWPTWVKNLSWSSFIPSISWSSFIPSIRWSSFVPKFSWPSIPTPSFSRPPRPPKPPPPTVVVVPPAAPAKPAGGGGGRGDLWQENFGMGFFGTGGIAMSPMLAGVAEGGEPEAIIPLSRLDSLLSGGGRSGGGGITVNGDIYGWDDFIDKVGEAFREIRRGGGTEIL